jgi:hypothetical protein
MVKKTRAASAAGDTIGTSGGKEVSSKPKRGPRGGSFPATKRVRQGVQRVLATARQ